MNLKTPEVPDWELLRRYLGCLDDPIKALAEELHGKLSEVCAPKFTYREFAVERKGDGIYLYNEKFCGADIRKHLDGCDNCILLSLTLGARADALLRTLESSDMAAAVVCDALASVLTEQLCDEVLHRLREQYIGKYLTECYSPGYGDLPLCTNKAAEKLLDTQRKIGVAVTDSYLLLPRKSITAIIGISDTETKGHPADCESCRLFDKCELRREGKSCGNKDI